MQKYDKISALIEKCTRITDRDELRVCLQSVLDAMGYSKKDLSGILDVPYRTIQDYFYVKRGIRGGLTLFLDILRAQNEKDRRFMQDVCRRVDEESERDFPDGIPSEIDI